MFEINELQTALVSVLKNSITGAVVDHVEPGTPYPYTVVGEFTEVPFELHDRSGQDVTVTFHVWSDGLGAQETNTILREINTLLHHQELVVAGLRCWSVVREFSQIMRDVDPDTGRPLRHGVVRYRIGLEEA